MEGFILLDVSQRFHSRNPFGWHEANSDDRQEDRRDRQLNSMAAFPDDVHPQDCKAEEPGSRLGPQNGESHERDTAKKTVTDIAVLGVRVEVPHQRNDARHLNGEKISITEKGLRRPHDDMSAAGHECEDATFEAVEADAQDDHPHHRLKACAGCHHGGGHQAHDRHFDGAVPFF